MNNKKKQSAVSLLNQGINIKTETIILKPDNNKTVNHNIKSSSSSLNKFQQFNKTIKNTNEFIKNNNLNDVIGDKRSKRSASSPQLFQKSLSRAKIYRKTSTIDTIRSINNCIGQENKRLRTNIIGSGGGGKKIIQNKLSITYKNNKSNTKIDCKNNIMDIDKLHIICNPLSTTTTTTSYPYSTSCNENNIKSTNFIKNIENDNDKPKCSDSSSCGSFLPLFGFLPQTYLSPKMKFSWWRNKIS